MSQELTRAKAMCIQMYIVTPCIPPVHARVGERVRGDAQRGGGASGDPSHITAVIKTYRKYSYFMIDTDAILYQSWMSDQEYL